MSCILFLLPYTFVGNCQLFIHTFITYITHVFILIFIVVFVSPCQFNFIFIGTSEFVGILSINQERNRKV